ncbi:hypothetical protein [Chelativorans sp. M5D2P16]|uniref:hypothetical protein n=1 Tax=Chelativorans sp. M5D2P16 TaxID=3095678 RepID=UPI002ACA9027|nr:hypothetical protein [Chelativorans sp. M5D2P16]MDZ5695785.1 hypothetical protein [Chelativorans sp. M5D2P16]
MKGPSPNPQRCKILDFVQARYDRVPPCRHGEPGRPGRHGERHDIGAHIRPVDDSLPRGQIEFLVDDGLICPPESARADRKRLPVRNGLGRLSADHRLARKTGEFGRVQL